MMHLSTLSLFFLFQGLVLIQAAPFEFNQIDDTTTVKTTVTTFDGTTESLDVTTDSQSTGPMESTTDPFTTSERTTERETHPTTSEEPTESTPPEATHATGTTSEEPTTNTHQTESTTDESTHEAGTTAGMLTTESELDTTIEQRTTPKDEGTTEEQQFSTETSNSGGFCPCDVDSDGLAKDWAEQLWIDIVIILDVSQAMGQTGVTEVTSIIESFITRLNLDDKSTPKYSRVGLITSSKWPKVHFDFNMTSSTDLSYIKSEPYLEFNFVEAFKAAQHLFTWTPEDLHRAQVPRVIYLITNTRPSGSIPAADQFKQDGGKIVVADYVQEGAVEQPLLKNLASPGLFFTDLTLDYTRNLQVFCDINCFCPSSLKTMSGATTTKPTFGCYQPMAEPASFDGAVKNCEKNQMQMATIHTQEEEEYLVRVKGLPHWFGLRHFDAGFSWVDQEAHGYSNWAVQEPEIENSQNCAYALKGTGKRVEWFTGNCHLPFYYSCSSSPCSAEKFCSEDELYRGTKLLVSIV